MRSLFEDGSLGTDLPASLAATARNSQLARALASLTPCTGLLAAARLVRACPYTMSAALTVLVTGASAGFGAEVCRRFVRDGHRVIAAGRP